MSYIAQVAIEHSTRKLVCAGILSLIVAACVAPENDFDPVEKCSDACERTAACGWQGQVIYEVDCHTDCLARFEGAEEVDCGGEWASAIRCDLREFTCEPVKELPCKEENKRLTDCIGAANPSTD